MKVLHVNAGLEDGGGLTHIVGLLSGLQKGNVVTELLTFADGPVAAAARIEKIKTTVLKKESRYDLTLLKQLAAYINVNDFDVVHSHGARANLFMRLIKNKIKAKWLITVHSDPQLDFMNQGLKGRIFTKLNIHCLKKSDGIFAVTENFKNLLIPLGIKESKIKVIHNGIVFDEQIPQPRKHRSFEIINVGRLHPVKGQADLLKAVAKVAIPELHLTIIGEGPIKSDLKNLTNQLGISQQVTFTGFLDHDKINRYYLNSDIAVLTSISESFPLVLLEAANYALPLIATDVGDMSLMIPDQSCGWIVPINNVSQLAKAIQEAYQEKQAMTLAVKGQNMRHYAKQKFSQEQLCQTTISGYQAFMKA